MINTVTGSIDSAALGPTLVHEHVAATDWSLRANFGNRFFDPARVADQAVALFSRVKQTCGVTTVVDGTPINLGRDVRLIREVAERTGLTFIVSSGLYWQEEPWLVGQGVDDIVRWLLDDCVNGVGDTGIRPGALKAAVGSAGLTPTVRKMVTAVARVAVAAGLPVFCHHTVSNRDGADILDIFEQAGLPLNRVILGHSGDSDDLTYLTAMLARGCYLGMDRFGYCDMGRSLGERVATIAALCGQGYGRQLMLAHDLVAEWVAASAEAAATAPPVDFTFLHTTVFPALRDSGVVQTEIDAMITDNPRRFFEGEAVA